MMKGFAVQQRQVIAEEVKQNLTASASATPNPTKKKRSLPGNPDPNAEVIALSPNTLLATNRFACEICNKGFRREQNLQLHRRGHNLPWKLKPRASDEAVRKKVYVCPEPSCAHHDPCRALGDLTGIKKHFFRKHGEKKWSCEKCSKKYAVLSDWKAHNKVCGTKEYRCDCGTVFSRRDSFITHRAFCDVQTERTRRAYPLATEQNQLFLPQPTALQTLEASSSNATISSNSSFLGLRQEIPQWFASTTTSLNQINSPIYSSRLVHEFYHEKPSPLPPFPSPFQATPHLSATALLQKAAQMGATTSNGSENDGLFSSHQGIEGGVFGHDSSTSSIALLQEMMMGPFPSCSGLGGFFEEEIGELIVPKREEGGSFGVDDGMTRDFLGLVHPSHKDFLNIAGKDTCMGSSSFEQHRRT